MVVRRTGTKFSINMADGEDFLSQSYSFVYNILLKALIAVIVLLIATLVSKKFNYQDDGHKSGTEDTNFCSSSECLRCCRKDDTTSTDVLLKKLDGFARIRGEKVGLERIYKGIEQYKTHEKNDGRVSSQKPTIFYFHGISCKPWYDDNCREQLSPLTSSFNYELIKSEFMRLNTGKGWFKNVTPQGKWLVYHLFNQGKKVDGNCALCPNTVQVIESIEPFIRGCSFGNALFSVVKPGTHITAHYGPTNCRIRCHLPLFVPEGCCLCVNGEERKWKEKEPLLFDDSFLHEVWHRGMNGERVILMLDLWHPELTEFEKEALTFLFPSNYTVSR